jgi:hypothetical protein
MSPVAKTKYEGEVFTHRVLWRAARLMKEQAEAQAEGSLYNRLSAMLIARLTVEAYANFLLERLEPELFADEKRRFGSNTDAKLDFLAKRCGVPLDWGRRPYQTLSALNELRDRLVHAKPELYSGEYEHPLGVEPREMEWGYLQEAIEPPLVARAFEDVAQIASQLHEAARRGADEDLRRRLEPAALTGSLQRQFNATTVV